MSLHPSLNHDGSFEATRSNGPGAESPSGGVVSSICAELDGELFSLVLLLERGEDSETVATLASRTGRSVDEESFFVTKLASSRWVLVSEGGTIAITPSGRRAATYFLNRFGVAR